MNYLVIILNKEKLVNIQKFENRSVAYNAFDSVALEPGIRCYLTTILNERYGGDENAPAKLPQVGSFRPVPPNPASTDDIKGVK